MEHQIQAMIPLIESIYESFTPLEKIFQKNCIYQKPHYPVLQKNVDFQDIGNFYSTISRKKRQKKYFLSMTIIRHKY